MKTTLKLKIFFSYGRNNFKGQFQKLQGLPILEIQQAAAKSDVFDQLLIDGLID